MKTSPQKAIRNFCKGCIYDQAEKGNWLEQVERCTVVKCELYEHRPKTSKTKRFERENYLAMLSDEEREIVEINNKKRRQNMLDLHSKGKL